MTGLESNGTTTDVGVLKKSFSSSDSPKAGTMRKISAKLFVPTLEIFTLEAEPVFAPLLTVDS